MSTRVWITEEYGYREWLWIHPGAVDDVVADWKLGKIPPCIYVYGLAPRSDDFQGSCEEFDPRLVHWQKLVSDTEGRAETDPYLQGAIELHTRMTHEDELCRQYGILVRGHCHEWDDTGLCAMGVRYPAWWTERDV